MHILGTGLTGLIGSRLVELLGHKHTFTNISRTIGVDIRNRDQVRQAILNTPADVVLHLAAYTNVKAAELEKDEGEQSEAWQSNVAGTEHVAQACQEAGKLMIYSSTDLVFDGENTPAEGYSESDSPSPLNWYAKTKYEGELRVMDISSPWIIIRPAYPYRAQYEKKDFVRLFLQKLQNGESLTVLSDRIISPVFIDDLAGAIDVLLEKEATGLYHTVGSSQLSIAEAAREIADVFSLDTSLIRVTTRAEFLADRPPEPFNSSLSNAKIKRLGVKMSSFREGLETIKTQLDQETNT